MITNPNFRTHDCEIEIGCWWTLLRASGGHHPMTLHRFLTCRSLVLTILAVSILAASSLAEDRVLQVGKPEQVGMSARRLEIVNQILTDETTSGRVTAASVLVARRGTIVLRGGWGT